VCNPRVSRLRGNLLAAALLLASHAAGAGCAPFIEEHPSGASASLRPHTTAFGDCRVDEATYRSLVADWLQSRSPAAAPVSSLFLGRAVDFPWISRQLADAALQSPGWAVRWKQAAATTGGRDRLARPVLQDPLLLQRLSAPFEGTPYRPVGIGYEKVLFGPADVYASDPAAGPVPVPFDAQLWLRLARRDLARP